MKGLSFDWETDPSYVYIGRPSIYGNPIEIGEKCQVCGQVHRSGGSTLPCYRFYLMERIISNPEFKKSLELLKGKTLVCFCKPKKCHGDTLLLYVENLYK